MIRKGLKTWFNVHMVADLVFGIPLFFFPVEFLQHIYWIWNPIDPIAARMVGAAFIGIAALSYYSNEVDDLEVYKVVLKFKSVWSSLVFLVASYSAVNGGSPGVLIIALIFLVFSVVWNYYRIKL